MNECLIKTKQLKIQVFLLLCKFKKIIMARRAIKLGLGLGLEGVITVTFVGSPDEGEEYMVLWDNDLEKEKVIEELNQLKIEAQEIYDTFLVIRAKEQPKISNGRVKKPSPLYTD